jgi:hypothetical protein
MNKLSKELVNLKVMSELKQPVLNSISTPSMLESIKNKDKVKTSIKKAEYIDKLALKEIPRYPVEDIKQLSYEGLKNLLGTSTHSLKQEMRRQRKNPGSFTIEQGESLAKKTDEFSDRYENIKRIIKRNDTVAKLINPK